MSRLTDYSKFDHIDTDSEDEKEDHTKKSSPPAIEQSTSAPPSNTASSNMRMVRDERTKRFQFQSGGQTIYEWEQTLTEVILYVGLPPALQQLGTAAARQLICHISPSRLQLGLRGASHLFLDEATWDKVDTSESTWFVSEDNDGVIEIRLQKMAKGTVWEAALRGPPNTAPTVLDPAQLDKVRQEILLERWQEENPGMDFSGASFNGSVPDPRTYMGGVSYK